jgi:transcriptional antiterminator RfaH
MPRLGFGIGCPVGDQKDMSAAPVPNSQRACTPAALCAGHGEWMVLWTKSRQEKAVARYLDAAGADYYLPLVKRTSLHRGRKMQAQVPLFPGYVFLAGTREQGFAAIGTKRVCRVLAVPDQLGFVNELEQIRAALRASDEVEPFPFAVAGRRCRVKSGPFIGLEGVITDRLGPSRLVLQLAILGQGASLEIDIGQLEPID